MDCFWCATVVFVLTHEALEVLGGSALFSPAPEALEALWGVGTAAVQSYLKFKDAFAEEQRLLAEVQGPLPEKGTSLGSQVVNRQERFAQIKLYGKSKQTSTLKGNVDPMQIREGLYDTQEMRGPIPLNLTLEESEGPQLPDIIDIALSSVANEVESRNDEAIANLAEEGFHEAQEHELSSTLQNIEGAFKVSQEEKLTAGSALQDGLPHQGGGGVVGRVPSWPTRLTNRTARSAVPSFSVEEESQKHTAAADTECVPPGAPSGV